MKESGKPVAEVARELKINDNTLYGWIKNEILKMAMHFFAKDVGKI
ncbi:transposase [Paenibacillus piri]